MGRLVHTGLGSWYLIAHVLHCPLPPPAHSFIIGPAVISTHAQKSWNLEQAVAPRPRRRPRGCVDTSVYRRSRRRVGGQRVEQLQALRRPSFVRPDPVTLLACLLDSRTAVDEWRRQRTRQCLRCPSLARPHRAPSLCAACLTADPLLEKDGGDACGARCGALCVCGWSALRIY